MVLARPLGIQGHLLLCLSHDGHPLRGKFDHVRTVHAVTLPSIQFDKDDGPVRIAVSTVGNPPIFSSGQK